MQLELGGAIAAPIAAGTYSSQARYGGGDAARVALGRDRFAIDLGVDAGAIRFDEDWDGWRVDEVRVVRVRGMVGARYTLVWAEHTQLYGRLGVGVERRSARYDLYLDDIPLVDVLQWLGTSRKTGTLNVRRTDQSRVGRIALRDGYAFYASIEGTKDLDPEKAMMRMLAWSKGTFSLDNNIVEDVPKEIQTSLEHVLMESARQQDEIEHLRERRPLPTYDSEIQIMSPSPVRWRELEPLHLDMVQDLIERRKWAYVLDSYPNDDLSLYRAIADLRKRGVVDYD